MTSLSCFQIQDFIIDKPIQLQNDEYNCTITDIHVNQDG